MYSQENIRSPRASNLGNSTLNFQLADVSSLQQALLQKDQQISTMKGTINKLELKNKEYSSYQQAMVEYQQRVQQIQAQLLKVNQKLRAKSLEYDQIKKKLDQQLKQRKEKAGSFVRHQDYSKVVNQFKLFKQHHKNCGTVQLNNVKQQEAQKINKVQKQIQDLKKQIESCNNIISSKNSQINSLKLEKYNIKTNQSIESKNELAISRQSNNIISSFRIIGEDNPSFVSISGNNEVERMNQDLAGQSRENMELRSKVNRLQQQLQQYMNAALDGSMQSKNHQYAKIIEQYQASLAQMANKLNVVHKLELEKSALQQQRRRLEVLCEQLRQDLGAKTSYCQSLQKKLRQYYKGNNMQADIQNFHLRNQKLARDAERLQQVLKQKYEQIVQLKKQFLTLQITQQTIKLMEQSLNSLQDRLKITKQQLNRQRQRVLEQEQKTLKAQREFKKLQLQMAEIKSEVGKTNRVLSQKVQKIEFQSMQIKRLQKQNKQKNELSQKLAKLQIEFKKLQQKYESQLDQSNELAMAVIVLSAQIERRVATGSISKQFIYEFQSLKAKSKQTQNYANALQERVKRLEYLHKQVVKQATKISQHLHVSHKRWNHYDTAMERLLQFLDETNQKSNRKYQQLDANIEKWLQMQDKRLKELQKADPFYADGPYAKYTTKVTIEPMQVQKVNKQS